MWWRQDFYSSVGVISAGSFILTIDYVFVPHPYSWISRFRIAFLIYCWACVAYLAAVAASVFLIRISFEAFAKAISTPK